MQTEAKALLHEMAAITEAGTIAVKEFKKLPDEKLNYKTTTGSWSILECIEHLNLYGDFYLPEMEKQILSQKTRTPSALFRSGILGNYFAELMKGKNGKIKKMQSPKDKDPIHSVLSVTTLDRFIKQQERLQNIIIMAATVDLAKTKTSISISRLVKLRLGDTLRFFVYHIQRHIAQAERVRAAIPANNA